MSDSALTPSEMDQIGRLAEGTVIAVFRWGIILELGLSRVGLIDALYIDDGDEYVVGHSGNSDHRPL